MSNTTDKLKIVLANTYSLYLKTQGYHWNVKGPNFYGLHKLFEEQYEDLAGAVDSIAECIVSLGDHAPATYGEYGKLSILSPADISKNSQAMLEDLVEDQEKIMKLLQEAVSVAEQANDEATADMLIERIEIHQKAHWMLKASLG